MKILLKTGVRYIIKFDLSYFKIDKILRLITDSKRGQIYVLCNSNMLQKIKQLVHELSLEIDSVEFHIITIDIDDDEVIIAW